MTFDFDTAPGFLMDRNAHLLRRLVKKTISKIGINLTTEEVAILIALVVEDGRRIGDLAALLLRDITTITRQVESLEKKGCAKRRLSSTDRRAVEVWITEKGREFYEQFEPELNELRERTFEGLSDYDMKILTRCLQTIRNNFLNLE
ncbi:MAG: hypothetical protein CMO55_24900 [Verrucomicrobiales bacterium]|nr:hypothetical protein [Verrucomicrobiales bacterium]